VKLSLSKNVQSSQTKIPYQQKVFFSQFRASYVVLLSLVKVEGRCSRPIDNKSSCHCDPFLGTWDFVGLLPRGVIYGIRTLHTFPWTGAPSPSTCR
jgi:hypothetical protein